MTGHHPKRPTTYVDAGVDIEAGDSLVRAIKPAAKSTQRAGVMGGLGGFGALFDLKAAGFRDPILVSGTDGVGTKLKLAIETGKLTTVGIDLVAMCVNDIVVQGAEPLFFLDYYACGRLEVAAASAVVEGIAAGCRQAGCALVGGETAEMPGFYDRGHFDLAGFAVGAAERGALLPSPDVGVGDVLIGLASSGFHSNGYSLLRKVVADSGLGWDATCPYDAGRTLGDALLTPTRIYVRSCVAALKAEVGVKALAHITGGGLTENLPRVLPDNVTARIDLGSWPTPAALAWVANAGQITEDELLRTFNCGLGMIAVVPSDKVDNTLKLFRDLGEVAHTIGRIEAGGDGSVAYDGALALTR